jgi:hypothetical protein
MKAQSELREDISKLLFHEQSCAKNIDQTDYNFGCTCRKEQQVEYFLSLINKREALLKKKFEEEVIGKDEPLTKWKQKPNQIDGDKYCCPDGCEACARTQGKEMGKNELRAEQRNKLKEIC